MKKKNKIKVLLLDIETLPVEAFVWGIWNQNVALNQIKRDWTVLAWAAKWLGESSSKTIYLDQRKSRNIHDDKKILKKIHKLLNQADIIIGHNVDNFDRKKLNARFLKHGLGKPSPYKTIDTLKIAKKHFALTSNKLEYLAKFLGLKQQKSKHKKYPGFELWVECRNKNLDAFKEMEKYNKQDIVVLEQVYKKLQPWDNSIDFSLYSDNTDMVCNCGSKLNKKEYYYMDSKKYERYRCVGCGAWFRNRKSIATKSNKKGI